MNTVDLSVWAVSQVISKLTFYCGYAAGVGGLYVILATRRVLNIQFSQFTRAYSRTGIGLAFFAVLLLFFLQVGALSDTGLSGMLDPTMANILWHTHAGPVLLAQLAGLLCLFIASFWIKVRQDTGGTNDTPESYSSFNQIVGISLYGSGAVITAASLSPIGHTAELAWIFKLLISLHVMVMAWWIGALWPLQQTCKAFSQPDLAKLMTQFGQIAMGLVGILLIAGGLLLLQIIPSWRDLLDSVYGNLFLTKLLLVSAILAIAARHKIRFTPYLATQTSIAERLSRSIIVELAIALAILTVTACLTTVVGPAHS